MAQTLFVGGGWPTTKPARIFTHFDDRMYRLSHMRAPRGQGSWAFQFSVGGHDAKFAPGSLTLADAKKWARTEAARLVAIHHPNAKQFNVVVDILP
jgi:hypothetical protein